MRGKYDDRFSFVTCSHDGERCRLPFFIFCIFICVWTIARYSNFDFNLYFMRLLDHRKAFSSDISMSLTVRTATIPKHFLLPVFMQSLLEGRLVTVASCKKLLCSGSHPQQELQSRSSKNMISCQTLGCGSFRHDGVVVVCPRHSSTSPARTYPMMKTAWTESSVATTCSLWGLSDNERDSLLELGRRVSDVDYYKNEPSEVLRFMRARPNDLDAAELMFRNMVQWRLTNAVDDIIERRPDQVVLDHIPGAILSGRDKDGDPIFLSRSGLLDAAGIVEHLGAESLIHYTIWIRELVVSGEWRKRSEIERGKPYTRILIIEDLQHFSLTKFVRNPGLIALYGEMMRIDQSFYPEASKKIIVIRTPGLFRLAWNAVKGFFDPYVVEKLEFCGDRDVEACLSRYIDLQVLPKAVLPHVGLGTADIGMPGNFAGGTFNSKFLST